MSLLANNGCFKNCTKATTKSKIEIYLMVKYITPQCLAKYISFLKNHLRISIDSYKLRHDNTREWLKCKSSS